MPKKNNSGSLGELEGFFRIGAETEKRENIPTGHFKLDFAIQYGMDPSKVDLSKIEGYDPKATLGIPLGPLVEFYGEEGSGKSSLAYRVAGYAQKKGHQVAWIDVERSYKENLAILNGCDPSKLLYSNMVNPNDPDKPIYGEHVFGHMIKAMKYGCKVIVLDSVANLVPKAQYEAHDEQQFMGLLSRMLSTHLGKLVAHAEHYGCLVIFINQLRKNLSVGMYGDPDTSPGGHSLKHNVSLRLKVSKKNSKDANIWMQDPDDEDASPILMGRIVRVKIDKNRYAKPFLEPIEIPIYFEEYFPDREEVAFDTGRQLKLISVRNKVYKWGDIKVEGKQAFIEHIKDNKLLDALVEDIKNKAEETGVILPPEIILYDGNSSGGLKRVDKEVPGDAEEEDNSCSETIPKKPGRKRSS